MAELTPNVVVLIFYLYLLARWQNVRRPLVYLLGACGIAAFDLLTGIFILSALPRVAGFFAMMGTVIGFLAAVGACYGSELPVKIASTLNQATSVVQGASPAQPAPPAQTPPPAAK
jgi:hypothetical protein